MATDHAETVADLLKGAGISNVFIGYVRELADDLYPAVFVTAAGGIDASPFFGGGATSYKQAAVQITVLGRPRAYQQADTIARACYDAVDHVVPTGYTAIRPRQSGPMNMGVDEENRPDIRMNVLCQIVE